MLKPRGFPLLLLLASLLLAACAHRPVDPRLRIDGGVAALIEVDRLVTARNGDLLRCEFRGRNRSLHPLRIGYTIHWYDAAGMHIETLLSRQQTLEIRPRGEFSLGGPAPSPKAVDFRIHIFTG